MPRRSVGKLSMPSLIEYLLRSLMWRAEASRRPYNAEKSDAQSEDYSQQSTPGFLLRLLTISSAGTRLSYL